MAVEAAAVPACVEEKPDKAGVVGDKAALVQQAEHLPGLRPADGLHLLRLEPQRLGRAGITGEEHVVKARLKAYAQRGPLPREGGAQAQLLIELPLRRPAAVLARKGAAPGAQVPEARPAALALPALLYEHVPIRREDTDVHYEVEGALRYRVAPVHGAARRAAVEAVDVPKLPRHFYFPSRRYSSISAALVSGFTLGMTFSTRPSSSII